ncbi:hypothetical protein QCA50_019587 [Cerrena zonata]|uniref:DUF6535 domain-containing protein n=1 Tax=Cerrena zonata TaxID=2478898 RepID=A0AAW0FDL7_9APHY
MSSSSRVSSRQCRRSSTSTWHSRASNSDLSGDPIQVSTPNSQNDNDEVPDVENLEDEHKSSAQNGPAQLTQQIEGSQTSSPTPLCHGEPQEIEADTVPVNATSTREEQQQQQHQAVGQLHPENKDTSPDTEDKVHRVKIESDRTGWGRISDLIRQYDRDRVEDVKEDIDTLLVFAGLFSAVITAFIIESYKTLQQQPEDTTNQILLQLSAQLASLTLSGNFANSTIPAFTTPSFIPARLSVLVNTLWLLSLVFALITASLGILVKQWLHELMARDTQDPRQQVKIRFFREVGVQRWQVFEIAAALPLLLQLALLLFFVGLSAFLHDLNPVVTWVVTGVMIIWLSFYLFTTLAPAFSSQCPYKTPMLKGLLQRTRVGSHTWLESLSRTLHTNIPNTWPTIKQRCGNLRDLVKAWSDAWMSREESKVREDDIWDLSTLACSQEILRGEQLEETITDCFQKSDLESLFRCIRLYSRGKSPVIQGILPDLPQGLTRQTCELFASRISDLPLNFNDLWILKGLYDIMTYVSLELYNYNPDTNSLIPQLSLPMHARLINEDEDSAICSILTMYSIMHRTMEDHPEHSVSLFPYLPYIGYDDERTTYGAGAQFLSNLVAATKDICRRLQDFDIDSEFFDLRDPVVDDIRSWIGDIPTDPIALISTLAEVLHSFTSRGARQEHRDILVEVMGELATVLTVTDGSPWSRSHRACAERTHEYLIEIDLVDTRLIPKLGDVIRSWKPNFDHTRRPWFQRCT